MRTDSPAATDPSPAHTEAALRESEARTRAKLNGLLSPEDNLGSLGLGDIIDAPALQTLMDQFFKLTGIGMAIIDMRGQILIATGWQDICVKFHRVHPATCQNCLESDTELSGGVDPGTFKLYRCKNNMYDIATPIVVGGRQLGNLFLGQFFFEDEAPDREVFRDQARRYGFDEPDYLAALDRTPRWSRDTVQTVMEFYAGLTQLFSSLSYSNLRLARSMADQQWAEESLRGREAQYQAAIETAQDGFWMTDRQGRLLEVNDSYVRLSGYTRAELLAMRIADLEAQESPAEIAIHAETAIRQGGDLFQTLHRTKSGRVWPAEINVSYWSIAGGRFFAFIRDIHRRQQSEELLKARLHLSEMAATASLDDLLRTALDLAERFTGSQIGFFHFVDPDQEHLTLQTWSTDTLKNRCAVTGRDLHYPISAAGVWVDCLRQRQPIIHNDYATLPHRHDLPEGHAPVIRELTVPILRHERVLAIIGVGNKPEDYTAEDVEVVQQLAAMLMDMVERKQAEEQIADLAYHDALTRLPNRVLLTDRLQQAMAHAQRNQRQLAVCFLDLDNFKPINESWGHTEGDRVLIEVAHRLTRAVRAGDTVARLGGDEFALLLGNLPELEECQQALDRVMAALQAPVMVAGQAITLTASLGVTLYPDDSADPDTLLRHVDQAMYIAKQSGGNRYQMFDAGHDRRARDYRTLLQRVQDGLAAGEFRLYYQPEVSMRQGMAFGAEALIRWQHPEEGLLAPARFMPMVETSELAVVIDHWVLQEAMRQRAVWAEQGLHLPVSVNLSSRCLQSADFTTRLQALLADYPTLPAAGLILEILETSALEDIQTVSRLIMDCQQLGVRFALDDFGTGYSSLTYLKHLPVQFLKIDQSFVRDMLTDREAQAIVEGVIGLSGAFRREVIAEGVETIEHGHRLLQLGCDFAQGYGIARPMPPERIPAWIAGWQSPEAWANQGGAA